MYDADLWLWYEQVDIYYFDPFDERMENREEELL